MSQHKESQEELSKVLDLLRIEMEEDRRLYQDKMKVMSLNEKKEEGFAWHPVRIKDSYYGVGERLIVEIEKSVETEYPHQFQTGKTVKLFTTSEKLDDEKGELAGVLSGVGDRFLKIVFFADELPDWTNYGKLGVELMFDESSYKEMEAAIKHVSKARNCRLAELREVILGNQSAQKQKNKKNFEINNLNKSQNLAVINILEAEDVAIIHGPPGTGKTTTLVEAIVEVLKSEEQVLVCAPSNTAVDLLTEKLAARNIKVTRIGNPARVNEEQLQHTVDFQIGNHRDFKRIKELRKSANELRTMGMKYKRNFGREEREQRKVVLREARKMSEEAGAIESYIIEDVIEKARVITCTLVGSANYMVRDREYSTVFIDEASQALEPASWIPIIRAGKVVFAGDHCQLPPTVKSFEASKAGLSKTLFEKCIERQKVDVMLTTQYRMNEQIMQFSNRQFYKGELEAAEKVRTWTLSENLALPEGSAVEFVDTAGSGFSEEQSERSRSTFNKEEALLLIKHFKQLIDAMKASGLELNGISVGIISPYKAQVELLKKLIEEEVALKEAGMKISVNTVDGFQGQERDIIYISMVRSNDKREIGFLSDMRRMNVAMTRARKKLVLIGDSSTLGEHPFYKNFLDYIEEIGAYRTAWEFINL